MQEKKILGVILAGGASRRFGADKCAALLGGKPLLEWAIERARPQVGLLLLNANSEIRCAPEIERLSDHLPGEGPLAGILAALKKGEACNFTHVASFACDTPFFPSDIVEHLSQTLHKSPADYVVARCEGTLHRIFALWPISCRPNLEAAFAAGARSMQSVENRLMPTCADFLATGGPRGDPFFNINTPEHLATAEHWLSGQHGQLRN
jgi:molybdopterin-guanine dinucleotide biosynthesis protein A